MNRKVRDRILTVFLFVQFLVLSIPKKVAAIIDGGGGSTYEYGFQIGGISIPLPSLKYDLTNVDGVVLLIGDILNFLIGFSAIVAVIMIIYGGYTFIMSGGDAENISKGSKVVTAAIVGMIIVFLAKLIITFVLNEFLLK